MHFFVLAPLISFLTEKIFGSNPSIPRSILFIIVFANMTYILTFPVLYIRWYSLNPLACSFYLMFACIWFFKFLSYHHIWHDVRYHVIKANKIQEVENSKSKSDVSDIKTQKSHRKKASISKSELGDKLDLPGDLVDEVLKYPNNIKAWDVWIFCLIPTLCFQLKYPFYKKINVWGFIYRMTECFFFTLVWITILSEFSIPIVMETIECYKREQYVDVMFNFLKLSVPNTYAWLIQFYLGFHCYLNAWAEITGFSDKNFYEDWWNSRTLGQYWRKWNLPMHNWLTRHIYFPMRRRKVNRSIAMAAVFAFSAIFHEYILAGCFQRFTMLGFNAMMCQFPIISLQEKFKKHYSQEAGNVFFWVFFCVIGQPGGMVALYYIMN